MTPRKVIPRRLDRGQQWWRGALVRKAAPKKKR